MTIRKKLVAGAYTAALGISLISGGTYSYFNDTEQTNNIFHAGTLDIHLKGTDNRDEVNLSLDNLKPGDWKVHQIRVLNGGTLDVKDVKLNVDYEVTDAKADNNNEDFADHILVHISKVDSREVIADWVPLSEMEDLVVANDLKPASGKSYQTDHRQVLRVDFKFHDNSNDQNIFQGDRIDFDLSFEASQKEGELR